MCSQWHTAAAWTTSGRSRAEPSEVLRASRTRTRDLRRGGRACNTRRARSLGGSRRCRPPRRSGRAAPVTAPADAATQCHAGAQAAFAAQRDHSTKSDQEVGRVQVHVQSKGQAIGREAPQRPICVRLSRLMSIPAIVAERRRSQILRRRRRPGASAVGHHAEIEIESRRRLGLRDRSVASSASSTVSPCDRRRKSAVPRTILDASMPTTSPCTSDCRTVTPTWLHRRAIRQ